MSGVRHLRRNFVKTRVGSRIEARGHAISTPVSVDVRGAGGGLRARSADLVWFLHAVVSGFFLIAWTLPWSWALWTALVGAVVLQLQWWLNDDVCVLTKVERRLRGLPPVPDTPEHNFMTGFARRLLRRPVSARDADRLTYAILWGGAGIAGLRLVLR